jgi:hypothetical protein
LGTWTFVNGTKHDEAEHKYVTPLEETFVTVYEYLEHKPPIFVTSVSAARHRENVKILHKAISARPLPQYAFMAWCSVTAQGHIYLYFHQSQYRYHTALSQKLYFVKYSSHQNKTFQVKVEDLTPNYFFTVYNKFQVRFLGSEGKK